MIAGDYMQVHSVSALSGMVVSMTTPAFFMKDPHCLTFHYEVKTSSGVTPTLEIHARMTDYMLTGKRIWTSQDYDLQINKASITLLVANSTWDIPYVIDFIAILASTTSNLIRVASVEFLNGHCKDDQTVSSTGENSGTVMHL